MKRFLLLLLLTIGFAWAEAPIVGNAYVISAIGIQNTPNNITYISGDTSVAGGNSNYVLAPQIIIYQEGLDYVGALTPYSGCLQNKYYANGSPSGSCFLGGQCYGFERWLDV